MKRIFTIISHVSLFLMQNNFFIRNSVQRYMNHLNHMNKQANEPYELQTSYMKFEPYEQTVVVHFSLY